MTEAGVAPLNTWTHFAWTKSATESKFYINGELVDTRAVTSSVTVYGNYYIGRGDKYFNGSIDEVRFWSDARTQTEIQDNLATDLTGTEQGLLAYYNFNQGVQNQTNTGLTTLYDVAENHNGTLNNFALSGATSNWSNGYITEIIGDSFTDISSTSTFTNDLSDGTWSITNGTGSATIDSSGVLTPVTAGTVTVNYIKDGNTTSKSITIVDPSTTGRITIVSSGGSSEDSGWFISNNIIQSTSSSDVSINSSDIESKLALGDVTLRAKDVVFSADLSHNTSNTFKILSRTHITNTSATTITTNGGDVIMSANYDDATDAESTINGYFSFRQGLTITTSGGDIIMAGGDESASGYAVGSSTNEFTEGLRIDAIANLNSGGGDIILKGKTSTKSLNITAYGNSGFGFYGLSQASTIDSGTGTIHIEGINQNPSYTHYSSGIVFSINNNNLITIKSANTTADAIKLIAQANGANEGNYGMEIDSNSPLAVYATGSGGGISMTTSQASTSTNRYDLVVRSALDVLAVDGPITMMGSSNNGYIYNSSTITLGSKSGIPDYYLFK